MPTLLFCQYLFAAAPTTQPLKAYTERVPGTVVKFDMLPIPDGKIEFSLDGQAPPKTIEIKRFWLAKTECTWDEYDTFQLRLDVPRDGKHLFDARTRPTPSYANPDRDFGHSGHPVISVTAYAGQMYCQWLSEKTGRKYRLPTPSEWEYACRAGGAAVKAGDDIAWSKENSPEHPEAVAKKKPNAFGLYDMLGNVGEWTVTSDGKTELLSGGHYLLPADNISSSSREALNNILIGGKLSKWWFADGTMTGFRVVREE